MKPLVVFECEKCGAQAPKWAGQCFDCGAYATLRETAPQEITSSMTQPLAGYPKITKGSPAKTVSVSEITAVNVVRTSTGLGEVDRVLGGGLVPGGLILLAGEPGIGKSTLVLQIAVGLAGNVLYVCGEEAPQQVAARIARIAHPQPPSQSLALTRLRFVTATDVPTIAATISHEKPRLAIVDSIQTVYDPRLSGDPGSVSQIRAVAAQLAEAAHALNVPLIVIGHVSKGGALAGPKTLEHVVDVVLTFEGDRSGGFRFLRSPKNRFGPTDEVGIFAMSGQGLVEVQNPSAQLLAGRVHAPGSILTCVMEGTRPLIVEIQALVSRTHFGYPQRRASGFELNRLQMLLAVLGKRAGIDLGQSDVAVNVVGGLEVREPAADLAVCLALVSAFRNRELAADLVALGEVGLAGEVRSVPRLERRVAEIERMGLKSLTQTRTVGEVIAMLF